jgi:tetratricopeptide (TPR) repeat protein
MKYATAVSALWLLLFVGCSRGFESESEQAVRDSSLVHASDADIEYEAAFLATTIHFIDSLSGAVWADLDREYYAYWQSGLDHEIRGEYANAIESYRNARNVVRYEMSSYDVLLPLGRALYKSGREEEADAVINQYLNEARSELSGEAELLWGYSEEGLAELKRRIAYAERLRARLGSARAD